MSLKTDTIVGALAKNFNYAAQNVTDFMSPHYALINASESFPLPDTDSLYYIEVENTGSVEITITYKGLVFTDGGIPEWQYTAEATYSLAAGATCGFIHNFIVSAGNVSLSVWMRSLVA